MGYLEQALAALDSARRTGSRNIQDLFSDPSAYAEKVVGHLRNTNAGVTPVAAGGELTNRPLTMEERVNDTLNSLDFGGGMGVVKPKGGNWLSGKYGPEAQLRALKKHGSFGADNPEELAGMMGMPLNEAQAFWKSEPVNLEKQALNSWIDNQLTKYVKNDMAAPTDPIRKLADAWPEEKAAKLAIAEARVQKLRAKQQAQAATRGVPEEYLTQTRQDILAAEEARDLIEANTGLHIEPHEIGNSALWSRRSAAGFDQGGMARTPEASKWEDLADFSIGKASAKDFQLPNNLAQDPWLAKVDPNVPIYNLGDTPGFAHITDELSNSLREGRLTPEQLAKMPIDQAVRYVAEINALRKVNAGKQQAMDASEIPVFKDYPEQGMSWRQLQMPGDPNEWQRQFNARRAELLAESKAAGRIWAADALNKKIEAELGPRPYDKLQKWLTQEGDSMGHCVGGYCDDVASGQSQIYSLRDAKGKPHVTIETSPEDFASGAPLDAPRIVQIKGPSNAAPAAEHLPFIQDFIKQGKWSEINDLHNSGMDILQLDPYLVPRN